MLLAANLDRLGWIIYALYHSRGGKPAKPEPYPRPGITPAGTARPVSPAAVAMLEERRQRNRQARAAAGLPDAEPVVQLDPKTVAILAARKAAKTERQQRG